MGLCSPLFELISDLLGGSDDSRPAPAETNKLGNLSNLPATIGVAHRKGFESGLACVGFCRAQLLVETICAQINTGPSGHQGQGAFVIDVRSIFMELLQRSAFGRRHDDRKHGKNEDLPSAELCRPLPQVLHIFFYYARGWT